MVAVAAALIRCVVTLYTRSLRACRVYRQPLQLLERGALMAELSRLAEVARVAGTRSDWWWELLELAESGQLPPQIAEQLAGLATGGNQLGNRGDRRAGVPFSTSPTGPQPQQEMPPASNAGVY